jgi:hypothetical protein
MREILETQWQKIKVFPIRRLATAAAICHSLGILIAGIAIYLFGLLRKDSPMDKIALCVLASYAIEAFVFYQWKKLAEKEHTL